MAENSIHSILAQFREEERHNRHLGDHFERLICRFLELDPIFADRFSNVWMWNEWPKKGASGAIGIVALLLTTVNTTIKSSTAKELTVCSSVTF